jgi:hypothetical protein
VAQRAGEDARGQVLGILDVAYSIEHIAIDRRHVSLVEHAKGLALAPSPPDQFLVAERLQRFGRRRRLARFLNNKDAVVGVHEWLRKL